MFQIQIITVDAGLANCFDVVAVVLFCHTVLIRVNLVKIDSFVI